jgi:fructoselysine-6-P-deglycase FrlB-like protein
VNGVAPEERAAQKHVRSAGKCILRTFNQSGSSADSIAAARPFNTAGFTEVAGDSPTAYFHHEWWGPFHQQQTGHTENK